MKKILKPLQISLAHITILLSTMLFTTTTFACTTAAWLGGTSGAVLPDDPTNSVARASGFCGLEVTGMGYVQDDSPGSETSFIGSFYFFPEFTGTGSVDLFVAYSDTGANNELFAVSYDGTNLTIDASANGGGSASVPAVSNQWNVVEFQWVDNATGSLWVNTDATIASADGTFNSGSNEGTVETVRLGAPNGFGGLTGQVIVDQYTSQRTQPVGMLLMGDSNSDNTLNIFDMLGVQSEILGSGLQSGQPDCNLDGNVNIFDMLCIQNIILN